MSEPYDYPTEVPAALAALCNECTAWDVDDRPVSAREVRERVDRYLEQRSSYDLGERGRLELDELRRALSTAGADAAVVFAAFGACSSAFAQALRVWPDNPEALAGHDEALALVATWELDHGRSGAAETFLRQLRVPRPELVARLAGLRSRRHAEARELLRLRRAVVVRRRSYVLLACVGALVQGSLVLAIGSFARVEHIPLRLPHLAALVALAWLLLVAVVALARRARPDAT